MVRNFISVAALITLFIAALAGTLVTRPEFDAPEPDLHTLGNFGP